MGERVLKWSVPVDDTWHPVGGGPVLLVACQDDGRAVQVWTQEAAHTVAPIPKRAARVFGTGQTLPAGVRHVGSTLAAGGRLVWHVYEGVTDA